MKKILLPCLLMLLGLSLCACSEEDDNSTKGEYTNWKARNEAWWGEQMATARAAIAEAKALYGNDWQAHSQWLILKNYNVAPQQPGQPSDSIPVHIIQRGEGSGMPLYTDTVSVCMLGRLMPTEQHPSGYPFSFTGTYPRDEQVFGETTRAPIKSLVSSNIAGYTTVLQYMHIGDRWSFYLHPDLAYGSNATSVIPAYSVLNFTVELRAYFKPQ